MGMNIAVEELNRITKESLKTALFLLLKEKPYSSISVKELAQKAGVSRNGFYRNYSTFDDIIRDAASEYIKEDLPNDDNIGEKEYLVALFKHIEKRSKEYELLLKNDLMHLLMDLFRIQTHFPQADEKYRSYLEEYKAGAYFFVINEWLRSGMKETVEEMAEIILKVKHADKEFYFSKIR